jgi:hypothetical protein
LCWHSVNKKTSGLLRTWVFTQGVHTKWTLKHQMDRCTLQCKETYNIGIPHDCTIFHHLWIIYDNLFGKQCVAHIIFNLLLYYLPKLTNLRGVKRCAGRFSRHCCACCFVSCSEKHWKTP